MPAAAPPQQRMDPSVAADARAGSLAARGGGDDALAGGPGSQRKTATVRFWLKFKAEWGQRLKVVGTHKELGE
jgi:hypothetical protein